MFYCFFKTIFFLIFKIFFRARIYGHENIPRSGGFIVASNHVSFMDPPFVGSSVRRPLQYLARHDLFNQRFKSWVLGQCHVYPLKRDYADISAIKRALAFLKEGKGLLLFPEGTRQADGVVAKPQPGIGFITAKSGVPVIPAYISGTQKALPKSAKIPKLVRISVRFGKPVYLDRSLPYQDIAQAIMDEIKRMQSMYD